jgi:hypothetical protein
MRNRSSDCRRPAIILALAFLGLVFSKQTIFAQADITLRFLDAASGKPIKGISVSVDAWDENRGQQKPQPQGTIKIARNSQVIKTDKNGEGVFRLYQAPSLKTLHVSSVGELRGGSKNDFSIEDVLRSGVVSDYHGDNHKWCVPLKAQATTKPGEIVIFDKRMTLWDHMRQEIP